MPTRIAARYMFVSGTAALVYEVLWIRDLGYVFGGSAQSLAAVVAAFLAGLALGAFFAGRRLRPGPRLLRVYAALELAIALTAPLVPWLVARLDRALLDPLWPWIEGHPQFGAAWAARFAAAFVVMLPATACMGATLPVLCAAFVGEREEKGAVIGRLYGWNTLGGVAGCLLAGFVLVEHVGLWKSRLVAAALNGALALLALRLWRRQSAGATATAATSASSRGAAVAADAPPVRRPLAVPIWALALVVSSGLSIVLEFCWSRLVALGVGGTTYAFSIVLAVYLLGLGGGALIYGWAARRRVSPVALLAGSQIALAAVLLGMHGQIDDLLRAIGLRLFAVTSTATEAAIAPLFARAGLGLALAALLALLPSLLIGIAFPALSDLGVARREEIGRGIGAAYVMSTLGGVGASLATTFLFLPRAGVEWTLAGAAAAAGLLGALLLVVRRGGAGRAGLVAWAGAAAIVAALFALLGNARTSGRWDGRTLYGGVGLYGARALSPDRKLEWACDGPACSVAVFSNLGERTLAVNGKVDASNAGDMGTQLLLAWLPQLFVEEPRELFVLGYGAGVTAAAAARYGSRVQCAEIEPAVLAASDWFAAANEQAAANPRIELIVDDGRSLLRRSRRRFDVITTEPSNPWLAGMANLFTVEFYELCKARLAEGGVLCQWVQLYWSSPSDYQAIFATLGSVFPHVAIWRTTSGDTLMLGSERPLRLDPATLQRRVESRPWLALALRRTDPDQEGGSLAAQLARMVLLEGDDARAYADAGPRRIRDDVPFLEFSAARRMQADSEGRILAEVYRRRTAGLYAQPALAAVLTPSEYALLLCDVGAEEVKHEAMALGDPLLLDAARRAPTAGRVPFWLWLSASKAGRADDAAARLAALERATPELLINVAEEHERQRDFDAAWAALDRCQQRIGVHADVEYERGHVRELQGRRVDAAAHYERALKIEPGNERAKGALRRLRESR